MPIFPPIVAVVPGLQFSPGQALYGAVVVALWVQKPLVCCSGLLCVRWLPPQSPLASQRNLSWLEPPGPRGELNSPQRSQDYRLLFPTRKKKVPNSTLKPWSYGDLKGITLKGGGDWLACLRKGGFLFLLPFHPYLPWSAKDCLWL